MGKKDLYRLKDRGTVFTDPDSDFVISGDQQKPLPKKVGTVLAARVRTGALIRADEPPTDTARRVPTAGEQTEKSEEKPAGEIPLNPPLSKGETGRKKGKGK